MAFFPEPPAAFTPSPHPSCSVLIHLPPGLALHCEHHLTNGGEDRSNSLSHWSAWDILLWHFAIPTVMYLAWQLAYFMIVQVAFERLIRQKRYGTSACSAHGIECCPPHTHYCFHHSSVSLPTLGNLQITDVYIDFLSPHCRYETSYKYLFKRNAKADTFLFRLFGRGGVAWRLFLFGFFQLVFTLVAFLVASAAYFSPAVAMVWQVSLFIVMT